MRCSRKASITSSAKPTTCRTYRPRCRPRAWAAAISHLSPSIAPLAPPRGATRPTAKLSPREKEVLSLYVGGATINEIAEKLDRRKQTVSTQKVSGMAKLGIEKDADLFKHAAELGLLPPPDGR